MFLARMKSSLPPLVASLSRRLGGGQLSDVPKLKANVKEPLDAPRLNLVILALRQDGRFGGTDTAIRLFLRLAASFTRMRIVVMAEDAKQFEPEQWQGWVLDEPGVVKPQTVAYLGSGQTTLDIYENDYFLTTHWLTAYYAGLIKREFRNRGLKIRNSIYLIQDFEPGFYAWCGRYLLAESTYHADDSVIAVFNTSQLANYFQRSGYTFARSFAFEPKLSPKLRAFRDGVDDVRKERLMLVYGRPSVARNAFDLAIAALNEWANTFPTAAAWTVVSLGERHEPIRLGPGVVMRSGGKVSLETYGEYLRKASVGLSLMVSPHPSYPPLEMSEFGVRVVTNNFGNKDLSSHSPLITGVSTADPTSLAAALAACCEAFDRQEPVTIVETDFSVAGDEFPFVDELAAALRAG